jgi:hypothetical protein
MLVGPTWVCLFFFLFLFDYFLARNLEVRFLFIPSVIRLYLPVAVRAARRLSSCAALFSRVVFPVPLRRVTAADNGAGAGAAAALRFAQADGGARGGQVWRRRCRPGLQLVDGGAQPEVAARPQALRRARWLAAGRGRRRSPPRRECAWDDEDGWWGLQEAWWAAQTAKEPAIPASEGGEERDRAAVDSVMGAPRSLRDWWERRQCCWPVAVEEEGDSPISQLTCGSH